jgi:hypothetical protein
MPIIFPPESEFQRRGDRLREYALLKHVDTEEHRLYLSGPEPVARQVEAVLAGQGITSLELTREQRIARWTHRFSLQASPTDRGRDCLDLLKEVVTLNPRVALDFAIALDYYKNPESHEDPMQWANTIAGELVNRGKYRKDPKARVDLVIALASVVRRHTLFDAADIVCSVPGSDTTTESFSEQLATEVAIATNKAFLKTSERRGPTSRGEGSRGKRRSD